MWNLSQDILEKDVTIAHVDARLYCHFFNNGITFPYEQDFVFLHEHSTQCKYGALCDRNVCMYKHLENSCEQQIEDELNDVTKLNEETEIPDNERTFFNPCREGAGSRTN